MFIAAIFTLVPLVQAGPWVKDAGQFYTRVGYDYSRASTAFDTEGQRAPMNDERFLSHMGGVFEKGVYSSHTGSIYAEVGLPWHMEVFGSLPFSHAANRWSFAQGEAEDIVQSNRGFGDAVGGLRIGGMWKALAGSLGVSVRLPLYDNHPEKLNQEAGNADFYDDKVPLGQGTIDVDLTAAGGAGWSLQSVTGWAILEQGLRLRNRDYATAFVGLAQAGVRPVEPLALMLNVFWQLTANNGEQPDFYLDAYGKGPTIIDRQHYLKVGMQGMFDVGERLALEARIHATLLGARTSAGWNAGLGLSYRR